MLCCCPFLFHHQGTATSCNDTAGSDCTDDTCGSVFEEVETVFNMTGALMDWHGELRNQGSSSCSFHGVALPS